MDISFQPPANSASISIFDISLANGDIVAGDTLKTSVMLSLFCDAKASSGPNGGWWGDALDDYQYGSQLWTLYGRKLTTENLSLIKKYAENALQWMISDGVAKSTTVTVAREGIDRISMSVSIRKPDGMSQSYKFYKLWSEV